jgi:hygromycin-B 7''-O-kinase
MFLLPVVRDRAHYSELFKENQHWLPAINSIAKKHGLDGNPERGVLGSHIVYRVGNCWIKLMAPLFAKDMAFEISGLKAVAEQLSVPTPQILAEGIFEEWRYVVISHIEGKPIRDLWKTYSVESKVKLATQIAQISKELSGCSADRIIQERFQWNDFIADQYTNFETQQKKKSLPEAWLEKLGPFIRSFDLLDFQTANPVFLHADLTYDHFLVAADGSSEVTGVIDMADCQLGHFEYELVAPCAFIFKSEPLALREYLIRCGFQENTLNQRFSEKLLVWSVLHRYFSLVTEFKAEMSSLPEGDFSRLAARVYPLA